MMRIPPLSLGKIIICSWLIFGINNLSSAASLPVFEQVGTIIGPASGQSTEFTIAAPGSYLARITDLTFFPGSSFNTVALGISTSSLLLGSTFLVGPHTNDSASFIFSATPGKYFSSVVATCDGICSYGVNITAVPIPPAIGLFGLGLAGLALISRRRQKSL
jgi:hypothetical protein